MVFSTFISLQKRRHHLIISNKNLVMGCDGQYMAIWLHEATQNQTIAGTSRIAHIKK
jgi:hypothetical protein